MPKGTPEPIVDRINTALDGAMRDPAVVKSLDKLGADLPPPDQRTPQALAGLVRSEVAKWVPLIHAAGNRRNRMRLTEEEKAMQAGDLGPAVQWAIDHQIRVGRYLGAEDFVPVSQAHIMADTELLGVAGVEWLERMAAFRPASGGCASRPSPIRAAPTSRPLTGSSSSPGCSISNAARSPPSRRSAS